MIIERTAVEHIEILLVEDNPQDAEMTMRSLRKNNVSNALRWVKDGQEALDFLFCEGRYTDRTGGDLPTLILLDIHMPKINGLEVLKKLKNDARLRLIPTVMMTSSQDQPDVAKAYELGANSFIVKPIDFGAFAEIVARVGIYWTMANRGPVAADQIPAAGQAPTAPAREEK